MKKSHKSVLVITGSRSEFGLLRPVMKKIQDSRILALGVLVTGMHTLKKYGNTRQEVESEFSVAAVVNIEEKDSMLEALAKEIQGIGKYCQSHRPDLIAVLGDRDEAFAGAIVGGHLGIPVAHVHGGDITGPIVDEYIRRAITAFSHLHFAATTVSAKRIRQSGEESWRIFVCGAPGLDEIRSFSFQSKTEIARKYGLEPKKQWFFILHHPTHFDPVPFEKQIKPLLRVASALPGEKIICYPNSDAGSDIFIREIHKYQGKSDVHIFANILRRDFLNLLKFARLLLGNSSMGIIDCSFLKIPTVNVGSRQAGRERGYNVRDAGYDVKSISEAILEALSPAFRKRYGLGRSPYGDGRAGERIVRVIEKNIGRNDLLYKKFLSLS